MKESSCCLLCTPEIVILESFADVIRWFHGILDSVGCQTVPPGTNAADINGKRVTLYGGEVLMKQGRSLFSSLSENHKSLLRDENWNLHIDYDSTADRVIVSRGPEGHILFRVADMYHGLNCDVAEGGRWESDTSDFIDQVDTGEIAHMLSKEEMSRAQVLIKRAKELALAVDPALKATLRDYVKHGSTKGRGYGDDEDLEEDDEYIQPVEGSKSNESLKRKQPTGSSSFSDVKPTKTILKQQQLSEGPPRQLAIRHEDNLVLLRQSFISSRSSTLFSLMRERSEENTDAEINAGDGFYRIVPPSATREKARSMFEDIFKKGLEHLGTIEAIMPSYCVSLAWDLESEIYKAFPPGDSAAYIMTKEYKDCVRTLKWNLEGNKNLLLCGRVLTGTVPLAELVQMTPDELTRKKELSLSPESDLKGESSKPSDATTSIESHSEYVSPKFPPMMLTMKATDPSTTSLSSSRPSGPHRGGVSSILSKISSSSGATEKDAVAHGSPLKGGKSTAQHPSQPKLPHEQAPRREPPPTPAHLLPPAAVEPPYESPTFIEDFFVIKTAGRERRVIRLDHEKVRIGLSALVLQHQTCAKMDLSDLVPSEIIVKGFVRLEAFSGYLEEKEGSKKYVIIPLRLSVAGGSTSDKTSFEAARKVLEDRERIGMCEGVEGMGSKLHIVPPKYAAGILCLKSYVSDSKYHDSMWCILMFKKEKMILRTNEGEVKTLRHLKLSNGVEIIDDELEQAGLRGRALTNIMNIDDIAAAAQSVLDSNPSLLRPHYSAAPPMYPPHNQNERSDYLLGLQGVVGPSYGPPIPPTLHNPLQSTWSPPVDHIAYRIASDPLWQQQQQQQHQHQQQQQQQQHYGQQHLHYQHPPPPLEMPPGSQWIPHPPGGGYPGLPPTMN